MYVASYLWIKIRCLHICICKVHKVSCNTKNNYIILGLCCWIGVHWEGQCTASSMVSENSLHIKNQYQISINAMLYCTISPVKDKTRTKLRYTIIGQFTHGHSCLELLIVHDGWSSLWIYFFVYIAVRNSSIIIL